ncbi:MAG: acyl-CoA thioesterase [Ruminococcus sp.]|nr:acyl-CoA thioesterase [Ruminococcus sp.]
MKKILPYERKVYYYETDKMGIMHHSNYIRLLEESRISFLEQVGLPFNKIEEQGIMVPVLLAQCQYFKPLVFDEPFAVYPLITHFNGVKFELFYRIISRRTGNVCAEGITSHCFTDNNLKPIRTKTNYPEIYKVFHDYTGYAITETEE